MKSMKMMTDTTYHIKTKVVSMLLLLLLLIVPKVGAQTEPTAVPLYQLVLWYKDGSRADFLATTQPRFYYADDIIYFSTKHTTLKVVKGSI